ncbi:MAG: hypothetical protein J5709_06330 [Bacteroidales bacterium]|nr:hypothetical protein [Bacteroidales bacterium]
MRKCIVILFCVFALFQANAQFFDNTLVKVRPFKFFFNPNIGLEKPLSSMFSLTTEVAYRRFDNFSDGSLDGQFFNESTTFLGDASKRKFNGVEFAFGARMYLITIPTKELEGYYWIAPFGLYYEAIVDYGHSWAYDMQIYDYGRSVSADANWPYYRADVRLDNLSLIMMIGYQSNFMNTLSIDLNIGARYYCVSSDKREVVSANPTDDGINCGDVIRDKNPRWRVAGRFTIGYYIRYDWMKKRR